MSRVVVQPVPPAQEPERSGLVGCSITVDTDEGVVVWVPDSAAGRRRGTVTFSLSGPHAVTRLVAATYHEAAGPPQVRLLFCNAQGTVLTRGRAHPAERFSEQWPADRLAALDEAGLPTAAASFGSAEELQQAHPGAVPLAGRGRALVVVGVALVIAAALLVLVLLG